MNYFLHYNNACPIFLGGPHHGERHPVPLDMSGHYIRLFKAPPPIRFLPSGDYFQTTDKFITTYRRERFFSDGRVFFIMIEQSLPSNAALMLLLDNATEALQIPTMRARIRKLEAQVALLRDFILQAMKE